MKNIIDEIERACAEISDTIDDIAKGLWSFYTQYQEIINFGLIILGGLLHYSGGRRSAANLFIGTGMAAEFSRRATSTRLGNEVNGLNNRIDELKTKLNTLSQAKKDIESILVQTNSNNSTEINTLRSSLAKLERKTNQLQSKINHLTEENHELEQNQAASSSESSSSYAASSSSSGGPSIFHHNQASSSYGYSSPDCSSDDDSFYQQQNH